MSTAGHSKEMQHQSTGPSCDADMLFTMPLPPTPDEVHFDASNAHDDSADPKPGPDAIRGPWVTASKPGLGFGSGLERSCSPGIPSFIPGRSKDALESASDTSITKRRSLGSFISDEAASDARQSQHSSNVGGHASLKTTSSHNAGFERLSRFGSSGGLHSPQRVQEWQGSSLYVGDSPQTSSKPSNQHHASSRLGDSLSKKQVTFVDAFNASRQSHPSRGSLDSQVAHSATDSHDRDRDKPVERSSAGDNGKCHPSMQVVLARTSSMSPGHSGLTSRDSITGSNAQQGMPTCGGKTSTSGALSCPTTPNSKRARAMQYWQQVIRDGQTHQVAAGAASSPSRALQSSRSFGGQQPTACHAPPQHPSSSSVYKPAGRRRSIEKGNQSAHAAPHYARLVDTSSIDMKQSVSMHHAQGGEQMGSSQGVSSVPPGPGPLHVPATWWAAGLLLGSSIATAQSMPGSMSSSARMSRTSIPLINDAQAMMSSFSAVNNNPAIEATSKPAEAASSIEPFDKHGMDHRPGDTSTMIDMHQVVLKLQNIHGADGCGTLPSPFSSPRVSACQIILDTQEPLHVVSGQGDESPLVQLGEEARFKANGDSQIILDTAEPPPLIVVGQGVQPQQVIGDEPRMKAGDQSQPFAAAEALGPSASEVEPQVSTSSIDVSQAQDDEPRNCGLEPQGDASDAITRKYDDAVVGVRDAVVDFTQQVHVVGDVVPTLCEETLTSSNACNMAAAGEQQEVLVDGATLNMAAAAAAHIENGLPPSTEPAECLVDGDHSASVDHMLQVQHQAAAALFECHDLESVIVQSLVSIPQGTADVVDSAPAVIAHHHHDGDMSLPHSSEDAVSATAYCQLCGVSPATNTVMESDDSVSTEAYQQAGGGSQSQVASVGNAIDGDEAEIQEQDVAADSHAPDDVTDVEHGTDAAADPCTPVSCCSPREATPAAATPTAHDMDLLGLWSNMWWTGKAA